MEFESFTKLPRLLKLQMIISEKIDGTNAQIAISDNGDDIFVGSRNRWITPDADNYGFAKWAEANKKELLTLGPGRHFGEWWGNGIQRGYGLKEKRFSLFNTGRWSSERPKCCGVVPVLYFGEFNIDKIEEVKQQLLANGSVAAPGYTNPEGVVVYIPKANLMFKSTFEGDQPKGVLLDTQRTV